MRSIASITLSSCMAASSRDWNRRRLSRASQYRAESPVTAPTAPATMTRRSSSTPSTARVEAAMSVVSAGNSAQTPSAKTRRLQMT
jgi:hypothetical protein